MSEEKKDTATAMVIKPLREARKENINRTREAIKEQNRIIKAIRQALAEGGKTIPGLAETVGMDTEVVLFYVSTLKKYGVIGEGRKEGSYFNYELIK
jgi:predicted transcriptional regulator